MSEQISSSSPTLDRVDYHTTMKLDTGFVTTGNASLAEVTDGDGKQRGGTGQPKFTPRAYSYAHPPPPSYRKVSGGGRRPVSPLEGKECASNEGGVTEAELPIAKPDKGSTTDSGHPPKPSFANLSEGTRLRLLKASLQQKAAEKKQRERDSMTSSPMCSPATTPVTENPPVTISGYQRGGQDGLGEPPEQLKRKTSEPTCDVGDPSSSSSSNSRSSSVTSSKNPSLDSLHHVSQPTQPPPWVQRKSDVENHQPLHTPQHNQPPWVQKKPYTQTQPPWLHKVLTSQVHKLHDQSQSHHKSEDQSQRGQREFSKGHQTETTIEIVQGKGIVTTTPITYDAPRRPSSSDIRARRESAEDMRLRKESYNSESSDSSDSDGDEGFALSMSKTFDEKLRNLLDFSNGDKDRKKSKQGLGDDDGADSEGALTRPSIVSQNLQTNDLGSCSSPSSGTDNSRTSNSSSSGYATGRSSARTESTFSQASALDSEENEGPTQNENLLSEAACSLPSEAHPPPYSGHGGTGWHTRQPHTFPYSGHRGNQQTRVEQPTEELTINVSGRTQERRLSEERRTKMGILQTTTPVNLKEFTVVKSSKQRNDSNTTTVVKVPRKSARDVDLPSNKTEKSTVTINQRNQPRSSEGNAYPVERQGKTQARAPNQKPEHSVTLPGGSRSRLAARKHQQVLPSRGKIPGVPPGLDGAESTGHSQTQKKLDRNAQHIQELLEEMHSERYLKMNRQQSDISGSAQKAAASRAASRRRRRSLGDEQNNAVLIATRVGAQYEQEDNNGAHVTADSQCSSSASVTVPRPRPPIRSPISRTAVRRAELSTSYRR